MQGVRLRGQAEGLQSQLGLNLRVPSADLYIRYEAIATALEKGVRQGMSAGADQCGQLGQGLTRAAPCNLHERRYQEVVASYPNDFNEIPTN